MTFITFLTVVAIWEVLKMLLKFFFRGLAILIIELYHILKGYGDPP
jgi:hypothetical protein